jgi:hypothetical protein
VPQPDSLVAGILRFSPLTLRSRPLPFGQAPDQTTAKITSNFLRPFPSLLGFEPDSDADTLMQLTTMEGDCCCMRILTFRLTNVR